MIDLHTHTTFSDGELIPAELARRAAKAGYKGLAITDHADPSNMYLIIENLLRFAEDTGPHLDVNLAVGVELTHIPPALIPGLITEARRAGAQLVVVHGETIVEPVLRGTNLAAIEGGADVLAHPGLITIEEAGLAAERGVHLEITTRKGHSLTNGHVAVMARTCGAKLVINNDAHAPGDLVSQDMRRMIALGAGLTSEEHRQAEKNSQDIFTRIMTRK
ncbi:histidinol phosphate phosphatase domain-containing protein [Fundidesulfovibrio putealis]|uniref:histidinol phosphate phosphatase domain-containing protein n=1 Tax=Fundidesulfovibrio putealis TaxID=270496 RepID=UPI000403D0D6|nr:histidinol phosphate phosphatase domain-containing protein [Fundidesulfovibrio putealis]